MYEPSSPSPPLDFDDLRARYLAAQLRGDRREALRLLVDDGMQRGATVADLQLRVVQEAQREIGRLWQEDRISIAQEHMATAISQLALAHLYQQAEPAPRIPRKILVSCVDGELHDFPARLAADVLDLAGFEVRYLGASVPVESLLGFIALEAPDLLALSVTMSFNVPALREAVRRVRLETKGRLPIIVGGHACAWSPGLAREVGADGGGISAPEMLSLARTLTGSLS